MNFLSSIFSMDEFKLFLNDQKGGLILPISGPPIDDKEWIKYKFLKIDKAVKSINPEDLPKEFCRDACKLVDEFRRKTVNLDDEWMLYFDYATGEVIYCFEGEGGRTGGVYESVNFENRNIASIHNHPKKFYSFPSHDNFEILEKDFEDYEIICSLNSFWIINYEGILDEKQRHNLHRDLFRIFQTIDSYIKINYSKNMNVGNMIDEMYSEYMLSYLSNNYDTIKISKMRY